MTLDDRVKALIAAEEAVKAAAAALLDPTLADSLKAGECVVNQVAAMAYVNINGVVTRSPVRSFQ
jgi:hypothetical protein